MNSDAPSPERDPLPTESRASASHMRPASILRLIGVARFLVSLSRKAGMRGAGQRSEFSKTAAWQASQIELPSCGAGPARSGTALFLRGDGFGEGPARLTFCEGD